MAKETVIAREGRTPSLKKIANSLTSSQKHAVNALLDRPGWNMESAVRYVSTLNRDEYERIRREEFRQRVAFEERKNRKK